ncbi:MULTISPECIES: 5'-3' exonuclease [unclassified Paenibacillus]|uniref:5'-3' exonuclease n=1 Tax=unclassified Paenibacillus TaxID=185978 RepID=UPI002118A8B7|nr:MULTISPECIES: 5'-3' exonuclease [unclassified Paenibacillus]
MTGQSLLLIDGFNLLSRAHFATSYNRTDDQLKNSKGMYTNALRVFYQKIFNLIRDHRITHLSVVWDVKRDETARRKKYPFYKATRFELPEPLIHQYETCKAASDAIGIHQISLSPYEADDLMGALSKKWSGGDCYIYSNDHDLFQLLSETTSQIIAGKQGEYVYSLSHFQADYGIAPEQWVDVKALLGDSSDNIPGCPGIGEKSALPLIQHYGSLERIYENIEQLEPGLSRHKKKLIQGKETALLSRELSQITCDIAELDPLLMDDLKVSIRKDVLGEWLQQMELKIRIDSYGA